MFVNEIPLFVPKNLLKIEMLENLRDFPRDITDIYYQDYSNGILTGCEIEVHDTKLILKPGILIYNRKLFYMKESKEILYEPKDCNVFLKVQFFDENREAEKIGSLAQILLETEPANGKDELELCRFRLQEGSRLRSEYVDLKDFATEYDTVNRIHVPYAAHKESTLWPQLLHSFAGEVLKTENAQPIDLAFCMSVLREHKQVERSMITAYLENRNGSRLMETSNYELYQELCRLLVKMGSGILGHGNAWNSDSKVMLL